MDERTDVNPNLTIPVGTQVVTREEVRGAAGDRLCASGSVGEVVKAPVEIGGKYLIRLPDGAEIAVGRQELAIRKHVQRDGLQRSETSPIHLDLYEHVIYRCVVGSRAYGLDEAESDIDRRGIYLPPAEAHWSLRGVPEQLERPETEECYWELQKFLTLALKANPNVLECLYTPLVEMATPLAEELLAMRSAFLSQLVYQTYNGYVISQFKKLEQDIRTRGTIRWKHAMHLIRLLLSGATVLSEGFVPLRVEEHRDGLLAIRRGEVAWEDVEAWRLAVHREFDAAFSRTRLPECPDYDRVNVFLIKARRSKVRGGDGEWTSIAGYTA